MTRREKFSEMMLDMAINANVFAVKNEKPCLCDRLSSCCDCEISGSSATCEEAFAEWLNEEYVEPPVDWSKVPIDTPILVKNYKNDPWMKKHFAGVCECGGIYSWKYSGTSWTSGRTEVWNFAKLATPEDLEG